MVFKHETLGNADDVRKTYTQNIQFMRCKPYFSLAFQPEHEKKITSRSRRKEFILFFPLNMSFSGMKTPIQMPLYIFFSTIYATEWKQFFFVLTRYLNKRSKTQLFLLKIVFFSYNKWNIKKSDENNNTKLSKDKAKKNG